MDNSRTKKSIRNTIVALGEQGIYTVMSFLCRTVFIYSLGKNYLGFSGLFSDILTLLSLANLVLVRRFCIPCTNQQLKVIINK